MGNTPQAELVDTTTAGRLGWLVNHERREWYAWNAGTFLGLLFVLSSAQQQKLMANCNMEDDEEVMSRAAELSRSSGMQVCITRWNRAHSSQVVDGVGESWKGKWKKRNNKLPQSQKGRQSTRHHITSPSVIKPPSTALLEAPL